MQALQRFTCQLVDPFQLVRLARLIRQLPEVALKRCNNLYRQLFDDQLKAEIFLRGVISSENARHRINNWRSKCDEKTSQRWSNRPVAVRSPRQQVIKDRSDRRITSALNTRKSGNVVLVTRDKAPCIEHANYSISLGLCSPRSWASIATWSITDQTSTIFPSRNS